jgi:hypothetical protein
MSRATRIRVPTHDEHRRIVVTIVALELPHVTRSERNTNNGHGLIVSGHFSVRCPCDASPIFLPADKSQWTNNQSYWPFPLPESAREAKAIDA